MIDGLWTVEFISSINIRGTGVLVFTNNKLMGGDFGYYYSGEYNLTDKTISGFVNVVRFSPNAISVFGDLNQLCLNITGDIIDENNIDARASIPGNDELSIQVKCKKVEDLQ